MGSNQGAGLQWVSMRHLQHFAARARAAGVNLDDLISSSGLTPERLSDADSLIPVAAIESMLDTLTRRHDIPLIGLHLANDIQPATFGALGFIAQACKTFGDGLEIMQRFRGLLSNIGELSITHASGSVSVGWECRSGGAAFQRQATEYVLGAFVVLMRFLLPGHKRDLLAVHFRHARPVDAAHSRGYYTFFKCPVYFGQPSSSVVLNSSILRARMPHSDAMLKELLETHATQLLKQRDHKPDLAAEVRHLTHAMLVNGTPTREMVATQLGMSSRSLHRKLEAQGSSYRQILHQLRLSLADEQLRHQAASVSDTAAHLGFANHQAFLRWFRQSTGMTPSEYRLQRET